MEYYAVVFSVIYATAALRALVFKDLFLSLA
jgi:hypothetical protein